MNTPVIKINDKEFPLATNLRVAYRVQGQHNHKPYTAVFQSIGDMTIEEQIDIIYAAFTVANPEMALTMTQKNFLNYCLDNFNLKEVMTMLTGVIKGITGKDEESEDNESGDGIDSTNDEGNL